MSRSTKHGLTGHDTFWQCIKARYRKAYYKNVELRHNPRKLVESLQLFKNIVYCYILQMFVNYAFSAHTNTTYFLSNLNDMGHIIRKNMMMNARLVSWFIKIQEKQTWMETFILQASPYASDICIKFSCYWPCRPWLNIAFLIQQKNDDNIHPHIKKSLVLPKVELCNYCSGCHGIYPVSRKCI